MNYTDLKHNEELEPGDFVVYSAENCIYYGFYKGIGQNTIQILNPWQIIHGYDHNCKPKVDPIYGQSKDYRVMLSHPDLVTKNRESLDRALEIIRETKILPVKY